MDSVIPGIDAKNSVSWIARQSSSPTKTALPRCPVMVTGSDSSFTWSIKRYRLLRADVAFTAVICQSPLESPYAFAYGKAVGASCRQPSCKQHCHISTSPTHQHIRLTSRPHRRELALFLRPISSGHENETRRRTHNADQRVENWIRHHEPCRKFCPAGFYVSVDGAVGNKYKQA